MRRLLLVSIFSLLSACAGTQFDWDQARQVHEGQTEAQVTEIMGPPYLIKAQDDKLIYVWSYVDAMMASRVVSVEFKDGKVVKAPPIPASYK